MEHPASVLATLTGRQLSQREVSFQPFSLGSFCLTDNNSCTYRAHHTDNALPQQARVDVVCSLTTALKHREVQHNTIPKAWDSVGAGAEGPKFLQRGPVDSLQRQQLTAVQFNMRPPF